MTLDSCTVIQCTAFFFFLLSAIKEGARNTFHQLADLSYETRSAHVESFMLCEAMGSD